MGRGGFSPGDGRRAVEAIDGGGDGTAAEGRGWVDFLLVMWASPALAHTVVPACQKQLGAGPRFTDRRMQRTREGERGLYGESRPVAGRGTGWRHRQRSFCCLWRHSSSLAKTPAGGPILLGPARRDGGGRLYRAASYQPGSASYQPGSASYQPSTASYQLGKASYQPSSAPYQPRSESYQPSSASYQPGSGSYQPGNTSYQPGNLPILHLHRTDFGQVGWSLIQWYGSILFFKDHVRRFYKKIDTVECGSCRMYVCMHVLCMLVRLLSRWVGRGFPDRSALRLPPAPMLYRGRHFSLALHTVFYGVI